MSKHNQPFLLVGDYIFSYAYPISFLGALFYGVAAIANIDPAVLVANRNASVALNILIGVCGVVSLFAFLDYTGNVPILGSILLPNGNATIKRNLVSATTYPVIN